MTGQTVDAARRALTARFKSATIDSAELDARLLVGAVLGLDLTGMIAVANRALTRDQSIRLEDLMRRRLAGEPVARILGVKEFWGLPLKLSPATLVPRPDTETVVELALEMLRADGIADRPLRVADLGTGTGAILLALLSELPGAQGIGTDISAEALETARGNAVRLGFSGRAAFIRCHYASALTGPFDLIVSNPPYVAAGDPHLEQGDLRFEPATALASGEDGLADIRIIVAGAPAYLREGGWLLFEHGHGQADACRDLLLDAGFGEVISRADIAGLPRVAGGRLLTSKSPNR